MRPLLRWIHRITPLMRSGRLQRDLDDELQFHLDARTSDNIASGMTPEEARRDAIRRFGNRTVTAERMRDVDVNRWLDAVLRNLQYSARTLRRSPAFTAVVIVSIGLGVGANTAIFSLFNAVFLKTLPVERPSELVTVQGRSLGGDGAGTVAIISPEDYRGFKEHADRVIELFTVSWTTAVASIGAEVEQISVEMVPRNYYAVLGVRPFLGRLIVADDDRDAGPRPVAVLGYDFWRKRFGGDPASVGRTIVLNGMSYMIIGVAPPGLLGTSLTAASLIVPVGTEPRLHEGISFRSIQGRLRPGVSRQQAASVLTTRFQAAHPRTDVIVLTENSRGDYPERDRFRRPLFVLMAAVALVLLIACANVASLLLARGAARRHEISIRLAIGAGRGSIIAQLLTESVVLAACGGVLGFALAYIADAGLLAILNGGAAKVPLDIRPDGRVLAVTIGVSLVTGLFFGLFPAFQAARTELDPARTQRSAIVGGRGRPASRRALVIAQVALSLMLLSGAGLFVRTLNNLRTFDSGYDRRGVLLASFEPGGGYSQERMYQLRDELLDRVRALPGVDSAGVASTPVLSPGTYAFPLIVAGRRCDASMTIASPGYLETMRMRLVAGRLFAARDDQPSSPRTVVVNEEIARRCFGTASPIGRRVRMDAGPAEVVGVVADAKYRDLREGPLPMYYVPPRSMHPFGLVLHLRTTADPHSLVAPIGRELHAIDAGIPLTAVRTLEEQSEHGLVRDRLVATVSATFAVVALALALVGLYGVLAFMVARRTNEIGVRMALGAQRSDVLRLILSESVRLVVAGGVIGVAGAYAGRMLVQNLLFGVSPSDQWSLLGGLGALAAVALVASWIPANRAARIDPMAALRHE